MARLTREDTLRHLYYMLVTAGKITPQTKQIEDPLIDFTFHGISLWRDIEEMQAEMRLSLNKAAFTTYNAGATTAIYKVGLKGTFNLTNPKIATMLSTRANMISGEVGKELFDGIISTVTKGFVEQGLNPLELAKVLTDEFDSLSLFRARAIARTETLVATERAQADMFTAVGVERKRWIATLDEITRLSHLKAHGQIVDMDEPFELESDYGGVDELMHPGDPEGPPEQVINCRCDMVPEVTKELTHEDIWDGSALPEEWAALRAA